MNSITPLELKERLDKGEDIKVIDVREPYEAEMANFGAELIPMGTVMENLDKIRRDGDVVVHCRSGKRSASVIHVLSTQHGYTNLINLEGGIIKYAQDVDPSLDVA